MNNSIKKIQDDFEHTLATAQTLAELEAVEVTFLGRKAGQLTEVLRGLKTLSEDERRLIGPAANALKIHIETSLAAARGRLGGPTTAGDIDVTLPGIVLPEGHLHLVSQAIRDIATLFERIGFNRVRYPEVEWDWYAFEALNMPAHHPARDEWETFFIDTKPVGPKGQRILTPHTSSGQVREMEKGRLPIRMMNISKCYRRQIDVSHVPMFHQFEGLLIDQNVTIAHLKGTLDYFVKSFFGPERQARIRPFHFQFTEPSFEIDVSCGFCHGHGCKLCKRGWLELGGAGMVHPNVLKAGKIDPKKYSGFAFGWGVERTYMMKAGLQIPDIRILYQNDIRFLQQF